MIKDASLSIQEYVKEKGLSSIKLHLACGGVRWKDFINVDLHPEDLGVSDSSRNGCAADVFADIRELGLPGGSVDEIFCSHGLEHFTRWVGIRMLKDWHRILNEGGKLHIETPDFWRSVFWLFHPRRYKRELARPMFFGNQWDELEYETHRYLWTARELNDALLDIGFSSVTVNHSTLTHHPGRDIKAVAIK
jgi:predicted SAM-dependent methyltransferase